MSRYLDRLIARATSPALKPAAAPLYDPFEEEEEISVEPAAPPDSRSAPAPTQPPAAPPPSQPAMKGIRIRSGELPANAPVLAPSKSQTPRADRPERRSEIEHAGRPPAQERTTIPIPGGEPAPAPGEPSRDQQQKAELQAIADRFMTALTGQRISPPQPPPVRPEPQEQPARVEVVRPRVSNQPPLPHAAPAPERLQPAPLIGRLTVEVLPPTPAPATPPRAVRTAVAPRSGSFPSGLRSPARFGLGQL